MQVSMFQQQTYDFMLMSESRYVQTNKKKVHLESFRTSFTLDSSILKKKIHLGVGVEDSKKKKKKSYLQLVLPLKRSCGLRKNRELE